MKKVKIQIKSIFGKLLFEYESKENTIKKTLIKAISDGANLDGANLYEANLYEANLYGVNLDGANLYGANLVRANLDGANLVRANLVRANLDGANLVRTNLDGANLDGAIKIPMTCKWNFGITGDKIHIGCEKRTIEEWDIFFASNDEIETERDTKEFKQIEAVYNGFKAYFLHLKN